jgi:hypothetical protein
MIPPIQNLGPKIEMSNKNVLVLKTRTRNRPGIEMRIRVKTRISILTRIWIRT